MLGSFIRRGAVAGLAGGAASALFLLLVGERTIGDAIHLEEKHGGGGQELYTRGTQVFGGALGVILVSIALGVIFATTFAAVRHRLPGRNDWQRSITWAATAFVVVYLVPFLKYPPNPPAVGDPDTIDERTILYFAVLAWSIAAAFLAVRLGRWLRTRPLSDPARQIVVAATWVVLVGTGFVVLPGTPDAVTAPATLIWRFRVASAGGALMLWGVTGVVFGLLLLSAARRTQPEQNDVHAEVTSES
ncbi:MAG TPA: CbtA family protein [Acidimicrobiia bacterium]|nr:CbtA family protein [Acidimicrobiia bacterium]